MVCVWEDVKKKKKNVTIKSKMKDVCYGMGVGLRWLFLLIPLTRKKNKIK